MKINLLLKGLVDDELGDGEKKSKNNFAYTCYSCNHHKKKLEVDFSENPKGINKWACWVCGVRGRSIYQLLKSIQASSDSIAKAKSYVKYVDFDFIGEEENIQVKLPQEYIPLYKSDIKKDWIYSKAIQYLSDRGITMADIYKYRIGYCRSKQYRNRIIIPTYNFNGELNYFIGRSFEKDTPYKYKNPSVSKNIIPNSHLINWDLPVILCEGIFDAIAIRRNAIPIFGKNIQKNLMDKLLASSTKKVYMALDDDAKQKALEYSAMLMNQNKEVYFVDLEDKDPSEMGFENFTKIIHDTKPLTFDSLIARRINS